MHSSRKESWTWAGHCEHLVPEEKSLHWTALKKYYPLLLTSVNSSLHCTFYCTSRPRSLWKGDNADKKTLFKIVIVRRKKYLYKSNQCHWLVMSHRLGGSWHAMQWCSNHISFLYTRSTFDHSTSNKLSGVRIVFRAASSPFMYDGIVEQWHILQIENLGPEIGQCLLESLSEISVANSRVKIGQTEPQRQPWRSPWKVCRRCIGNMKLLKQYQLPSLARASHK